MSSCCCGDDGGYGSIPGYKRRVRITDTTDKIVEISYSNSDKVFKSNDTIVDLVISENVENIIYVKTKTHLDTIVLYNKVTYYYNEADECSGADMSKYVVKKPIIVAHTFNNAYFRSGSYQRSSWYNDRIDFDDLIITP
ncbi:MAG: hypothetical protein V4538_05040 [Bacteroidota bacterium]